MSHVQGMFKIRSLCLVAKGAFSSRIYITAKSDCCFQLLSGALQQCMTDTVRLWVPPQQTFVSILLHNTASFKYTSIVAIPSFARISRVATPQPWCQGLRTMVHISELLPADPEELHRRRYMPHRPHERWSLVLKRPLAEALNKMPNALVEFVITMDSWL